MPRIDEHRRFSVTTGTHLHFRYVDCLLDYSRSLRCQSGVRSVIVGRNVTNIPVKLYTITTRGLVGRAPPPRSLREFDSSEVGLVSEWYVAHSDRARPD